MPAPFWWAAGLNLAERSPAGPRTADAGPEALARLAQWSDGAGVDRAGLLALLAESPQALAARRARPRWAELVERVIALAPETRRPVHRVPPAQRARRGAALFAPALQPFVDVAVDSLRRWADQACVADVCVDLDAVCARFADALGKRLAELAARTLVLELDLARRAGRLTGHTDTDRFDDFLAGVATADGLRSLCGTYPVLARLLAQAVLHTVEAYQEVLRRFATDRADIVRAVLDRVDPGRLIAIEHGAGDTHRAGRAVAVLRFTAGNVMYKPRSLALHEHFQDLVGWLNVRVLGLGLRLIRSLPRDCYGWQEYVTHRPCADTAAVEQFYHRHGALLALVYALDGTDVHFENVIADADQPVIVDIEALFQPVLPVSAVTGADPATKVLATSVAGTALLPTLLAGEHGAVDVSGLGADRDAPLPNDVVSWSAPGTDRMRLVRTQAGLSGGANRASVDGADVEPRHYVGALLAGFHAAYDAIIHGRDELLAWVTRCADDEIRVLLRSTQEYAALLVESTHPDVLQDGLDRDAVFDLLWSAARNEVARTAAAHEATDLWLGDVPIFVTTPGSTDLRSGRGERIADALDSRGLDRVAAKLAGLGELDRQRQEWVIRAAMATRAPTRWHAPAAALAGTPTAVVPDPDRLLTAACRIADEIVVDAVFDDHRVNWLGMEPVGPDHWAVRAMGAGLADGYTGVALFLGQLGALTGVARYTDLAGRAIAPLPRLLDALAADEEQATVAGCGAFAGLGGIAYALARLADLLPDKALRDWLAVAVPLVGRSATDSATGVADGLAGGLAALLAVHDQTGSPAAADWAAVLAGRLALAAKPDQTGFLYGRNGIDWALRRFHGAAPGGTAVREWSTDADFGWCHGIAGTVLASGGSPELADRFVRAVAGRPLADDMSLCHGELGVLDALTAMSAWHEQAAAVRDRRTAALLGVLERVGPRCGTPDGIVVPGLLTGLAGIGYGLLRLSRGARVPSVLLLATDDTVTTKESPK